MNGLINVKVNGRSVDVPAGAVVAAAVATAGFSQFRKAVAGSPRGPLCGMGICMECRVTVNGQSQVRSCMTLCSSGMEVRTDG